MVHACRGQSRAAQSGTWKMTRYVFVALHFLVVRPRRLCITDPTCSTFKHAALKRCWMWEWATEASF